MPQTSVMPTPTRRGRLQARRRRVAGPLMLTGLMVSSAATVGMPQTAQASGGGLGGSATHDLSAVRVSAAPEIAPVLDQDTRVQRVSRSGARPAIAATGRVLRGQRLHTKPPPWVLPVSGYHLTARFGQVSGLWSHVHTGLDFAAPTGTEIRSIAPGQVVSTAYDGAYGNKTVIRLDDGTELWYCHQNDIATSPGQRVRGGQLIGYVGSTGNVTGPHLHLEVHPHGGGPIDPAVWLPEHHLNP